MDTLLVIGSAPCVWQDMGRVEAPCADVMVCNRMGNVFPGRLRYWATYHPDVMAREKWDLARERNGCPMDGFQVVAHKKSRDLIVRGRDMVMHPHVEPSGSTALFGALFGLAHGYERVIVVGVSLSNLGYERYRGGWETAAPMLAGRVHGVNGWIKTFLEGLTNGNPNH